MIMRFVCTVEVGLIGFPCRLEIQYVSFSAGCVCISLLYLSGFGASRMCLVEGVVCESSNW